LLTGSTIEKLGPRYPAKHWMEVDMLMETAVLVTEIATKGTTTYTRSQDPYCYAAPQWTEPAADSIADALIAAGAAASQVSDGAIAAARAVLNLLADLPDPSVAVEDNEITLEWYKDRHHVAVVAVDGQSISWAVSVGSAKPEKGKKPFDNTLPVAAYKAISAVAAAWFAFPMHPDIADSERLAIFVFDSEDMREDGAHWKAFMPSKNDGERSLYRVDGLSLSEIAAIGNDLASQRISQQLRGWATISARNVRKLSGLQLKAAEPPERHGVIDSWPAEKHEKRSFAQSLAKDAATVRFPFTS
jgi:hypothetical protein